MLTKFFKRLTGLDKVEQHLAETQKRLEEAVDKTAEHQRAAERARQEEIQAKLTPKQLATERNESYIAVLDTKVNKDNVKNGFFELDWNELFIVELRLAGYYGETDEEIVDKWFQDLCRNIGAESGVDMDRRGSGYINVNNLGQGKSEIS
jgi:hypothetical protein